jgi:cobalamin synthase
MRRLFADIAFLRRLPVPGAATFDAADVGRATLTFPQVGALLGSLLVLALTALQGAWCMRKIGGMTGDTMGANTEVSEVRVFVVLLGGGEA